MKKTIKLCGVKKSYLILCEKEKLEDNQIYICNKCRRVCKDKICICYPEIKDEKYLS